MMIEMLGGGFENKGDELMLRAAIARLGKGLPGAQFASAIWTGSYEDRARCGLYQKTENRSAGRLGFLIDLLLHRGYRRRYGLVTEAEIQAVVDLSGFAYGDTWGPENAELMAADARRWKKAGKKIILLPQAFGPFSLKPIRATFREVLRFADLVFARDRISYGHVEELCGPLPHLKTAPDLTTEVDGVVPPGYPDEPPRALVVPNVQMVRRTPPEVRDRYVPFLATVIGELEQRGLRPAILLHTRTHDEELAGRVLEALGHPVDVIREANPYHLKGIISRAFLVAGSRYHALLGALSQGIPALGTVWAHKYKALTEEYGCEHCVLDVLAPREELAAKIDAVAKEPERSRLIGHLREAGETQRRRVAGMWKDVEGLLHG